MDWYVDDCRAAEQYELDFYRNQTTLAEAIHVSAMAICRNEGRHPHQYRRAAATLEAARDRLLQANVRACESFDQLHETVRRTITGIRDIGPLTIYDTAHRIGVFLGFEPEVVYLHSGTREGARALGLDVRRETIRLQDLPRAFQRLKPYEIEDCLCIYKDDLAAAARRPTGRRPRRMVSTVPG